MKRALSKKEGLRKKWRKTLDAHTDTRRQHLKDAAQLVKDNVRVSINMTPVNFQQFWEGKMRYLNLHDIVSIHARPQYEYERGELIAKRKHVDYGITGSDAERVCHGALNIGGYGLPAYGAICVVLKSQDVWWHTSFLRQNSFHYLDNNTGQFRPPEEWEVSTWDHVGWLAAVKHAATFARRKRRPSSRLVEATVASPGTKADVDYIEAHIAHEVTPGSIEEIRVDSPPNLDALTLAGIEAIRIMAPRIRKQGIGVRIRRRTPRNSRK